MDSCHTGRKVGHTGRMHTESFCEFMFGFVWIDFFTKTFDISTKKIKWMSNILSTFSHFEIRVRYLDIFGKSYYYQKWSFLTVILQQFGFKLKIGKS